MFYDRKKATKGTYSSPVLGNAVLLNARQPTDLNKL